MTEVGPRELGLEHARAARPAVAPSKVSIATEFVLGVERFSAPNTTVGAPEATGQSGSVADPVTGVPRRARG